MADNPKKTAEEVEQMETDDVEQSGGTFRSILKIFGIFLALAGIILAGFFAGIYLRVLDVYEMNEKLDLYAMPFIGEYFVEPMKKTPRRSGDLERRGKVRFLFFTPEAEG